MEIIKPTPQDLATCEKPDANPVTVYLARLGKSSRRTMCQALRYVAELLGHSVDTLPWWKIDYKTAVYIRSHLMDTKTPPNANRILSALRQVLKESWRLGLMSAEEYQRATDIRNISYDNSIPKGRALDLGEVQALVQSCLDGTNLGCRDASILGTLWGGGLRRAELINLDLEHVDLNSGAVDILNGKGRKSRRVYLKNGALVATQDWAHLRGDDAGPLFHPVLKGGKIIATRLSSGAVARILDRRARFAVVDEFRPHDLRRTFISDMLESGADISHIQKLAGHSSPVTTTKYDRRPESAREKACEARHFPYSRRA